MKLKYTTKADSKKRKREMHLNFDLRKEVRKFSEIEEKKLC